MSNDHCPYDYCPHDYCPHDYCSHSHCLYSALFKTMQLSEPFNEINLVLFLVYHVTIVVRGYG